MTRKNDLYKFQLSILHQAQFSYNSSSSNAQIAQSVEQRTENPCVGGSIPPLGTILKGFRPP